MVFSLLIEALECLNALWSFLSDGALALLMLSLIDGGFLTFPAVLDRWFRCFGYGGRLVLIDSVAVPVPPVGGAVSAGRASMHWLGLDCPCLLLIVGGLHFVD